MARIAVIGAGWAGLSAAVESTRLGHQVRVFEMAHAPGGRARSLAHGDLLLDNGQHILIGAYRDTLALMRTVGADPERSLLRLPLTLCYPDGSGLRLPAGPALPAFLVGVLRWHEVPAWDRWRFLLMAAGWRLRGFKCDPAWSVATLCAHAPQSVMRSLIEPLCVAALNTPADAASAQVFLTVLRDGLFSARGGSDLLLPRRPLQQLLPEPAQRWLQAQGAEWTSGHRVQELAAPSRPDGAWLVDGIQFDGVIVATPASEAARLIKPWAPAWAEQAQALRYEPIVTVWIHAPQARWPEPIMAFAAGAAEPAQFGFDLGALGGPADTYALVISGAARWVAAGLEASAHAVLQQLAKAFSAAPAQWDPRNATVTATRAEKRATFACTPMLGKPEAAPRAGLRVAGDYIAGPYPATLEAAVRSGLAAANSVMAA